MPNALFSADFGSFFDAVEKSDIKLRSLETGSQKVESSLSRMANAFSGQKVIQDATMMAKVFEDAGGAVAFTDKELQRMGVTANEAIDKLKALGKDVPQGIQQIADASQGASTATEGWAGSLKQVAVGYLSLQGLQQVWGFAREILSDADALEDLSSQTRIGVVELQNLGNVAQGFGIDMNEMGRALFGLSKRIGSGDDSVNDALLQMGLSIKKVKDLEPVEMFLTVADAAGNMNEQFKDTALATLFGDKIGQAMGGAAKEIRAAYDAQVLLNQAIGPDAVKAMADAERSMETTWTRIKAWAGINVLGPLAADINTLTDTGPKVGMWSALVATYLDRVAGNMGEAANRTTTLERETRLATQAFEAEAPSLDDVANAHDKLAPKIDTTTGATQKLREEEKRLHDQRFNPAETLTGFEEATRVAAAKQKLFDDEFAANQKKLDQEQAIHNTRMAAGEGYKNMMLEHARINKEATDASASLAAGQTAIDTENKKLIESWTAVGVQSKDAGTKGAEGGAATAQAWVGVQQQIEISADAIRGWLELMRATNAANALLNQNSLFTTGSTLENQSRLGTAFSPIPGFANGVENFGGGLAKVHGGEVLVNLPRGTSVIPKGAGGVNVSNTFNLTDTESALARRVAESIMRTIRAGTQLSTA